MGKHKSKKKTIIVPAPQNVGFSIFIPENNKQYIVGAGSSPNEDEFNFTAARSGKIRNLKVNVVSNGLSSIKLTVRKATGTGPFSDTSQTITIPAAGTGTFTSTGASVPVAIGDRISFEAITGIGTPAIFSAGFTI